MLFETLIPNLPTDTVTMLVDIVAVVGTIMVIYSQFVEIEHRRDLIRLLGALSVGIYALTIHNTIFSLLAFGIALAAATEFIEIYLGIHKHTREDIRDYFKLRK
jgi:uncharacterized membrane protein HdeD (DUF308 family)